MDRNHSEDGSDRLPAGLQLEEGKQERQGDGDNAAGIRNEIAQESEDTPEDRESDAGGPKDQGYGDGQEEAGLDLDAQIAGDGVIDVPKDCQDVVGPLTAEGALDAPGKLAHLQEKEEEVKPDNHRLGQGVRGDVDDVLG